MKKKKRETLFVIFAGPEQYKGTNHYYARDGMLTDLRSKAAKFSTWNSAKDFATDKKITLDALTYIGREAFELQG